MAVSKVIENRTVTCDVGSVVEHDTGRTERLLPSEWDKAQFRWPNPVPGWETKHAIACNVEITGRTFQYRGGTYYVRIRMIWVGDGEPDTDCPGWLKVDPWACPRVE